LDLKEEIAHKFEAYEIDPPKNGETLENVMKKFLKLTNKLDEGSDEYWKIINCTIYKNINGAG
jgi:hypothetical protein